MMADNASSDGRSDLPEPVAASVPPRELEAVASPDQTPPPVPLSTPSEASGAAEVVAAGAANRRARKNRRKVPRLALPLWSREVLRQTPGWLASMIVHTVVIVVLMLIQLPAQPVETLRQLIASSDNETEELDELPDEPIEEIHLEATSDEAVEVEQTVETPAESTSPVDDVEAAAANVEVADLGFEKALRRDMLAEIGAYTGDGFSGRGEQARRGLVARYGGTKESEAAVAAALRWLAAHQMPDGGWSFAHHECPSCRGQCRNPGSLGSARNAATGLALLPFLGAGQTHQDKKSPYRKNVEAGLRFLIAKMDPRTGSLHELGGSMYSHGIASIALCEAYAMTHDRDLYQPAQAAVNFICYAQDPHGGGWRYDPHDPGDTSVLGWQIMALKSGHMAYLQVPAPVVAKASVFLDSVQSNDGANYGYTTPGAGEATTAVGLLSRMHLGWKKDQSALERGVKWLGDRGPSEDNMYYNYYATQVLRHWEGDLWSKWNKSMRDQLVNSQSKSGHEAGSWYMTADRHHAPVGGRLYCTTMAAMILEVYYRYMPIYAKQSTEEDFPIE
ncbi:MAG: terpene cyclase/mutase family protein [Pirellulales bacterium]|nr:terpene cyclase/mutase family protein [Pirellulales bacterium]